MNKFLLGLGFAASLTLIDQPLAQARGRGGSGGGHSNAQHGGGGRSGGQQEHSQPGGAGRSGGQQRPQQGGAQHAGQSQSNLRGQDTSLPTDSGFGRSNSNAAGGYAAAQHRAPQSSGAQGAAAGAAAENRRAPQASGAQGAAAGAAASNRNQPQHSGAQGAAAGAAASNRNQPQASGAEGAAAGAAAENRRGPQYSGAQGAAAGAAAANRNQPQLSGAQGAAAGAAAANRNQPQLSGAEGAAAGAAVANRNQPQFSGAEGAAAGAAVANRNQPQFSGAQGAAAGYAAGAHRTVPVADSVAVARGAAVRNSFNQPAMYGAGWYDAHPGAWQATAGTAAQPWAVATWAAAGAAVGLAAGAQPISYNYGTNVTYQGDQVYSDGQPVGTADEYYQQAATLAQSAPAADDADQWTALGTFGLVRKDESDPHYVLQLAVNQSGAVAGNYCDMVTDHNMPIHGAVDPTTQKLAWTVGNNKNVVGEVGLYNLTQREAPALLHIGKDKTQQWLLVRLEQPAGADGQ